MLFKIAIKNLFGAKLRTSLNVFVTSISFFLVIFVSGMYDGMREHAKNITIETLSYFGLSMGTMFGVPLLASQLEFNASVIGLCGSSGAASMIGERLLKDAKKITHPTTFLMQLEDELFDRNGYLALFDAIQSDNKKIHANPGLHPDVPKEEIDYSIEFLVKHLTRKEVVSPVKRIAE